MTSALIFGSGAAAAGAALALSHRENLKITVINIGLQLETDREQLVEALASSSPSATTLEPGTISVAHPSRVTLIDLLRAFASQEDRRCRFVPVPWQLIYWLLRGGEFKHLRLPFRADSLLGLVHMAPGLISGDQLARIGVTLRAFTVT